MKIHVKVEKKGVSGVSTSSRYVVTLRSSPYGPALFVSRRSLASLAQARNFAETMFGPLPWNGEEAETNQLRQSRSAN